MSKKSSCALRRNILQDNLKYVTTMSALQKCLREEHQNLQVNAVTNHTIINRSAMPLKSTFNEEICNKSAFNFNINPFDTINHKHIHRHHPNCHVNYNTHHHNCHYQYHQNHHQPQQLSIYHKPHRFVVINTSHGLRLKYNEKLLKKSQRLKMQQLTAAETFEASKKSTRQDNLELRLTKPIENDELLQEPDFSNTESKNFLNSKHINTRTRRNPAASILSEKSPVERIQANDGCLSMPKQGTNIVRENVDLNANYLRFFKALNTDKCSKPNDRDIIFGNACLLLRKHQYGWERSRIEWLLQLECNHEDKQINSCHQYYQSEDNKSSRTTIGLRKLYGNKELAGKQVKVSLDNERRKISAKGTRPTTAFNTNSKKQQGGLSNVCCLSIFKWLNK